MITGAPILDQCTLSADKEGGILVERLSSYLERNNNLIFPHQHNFYHFVIFTNGGGKHTIDFDEYEVRPWQVYFMIPGQIHTWNFEGAVEGYIVNFSVDTFQTFLLQPDYLSNFPFFLGLKNTCVFMISHEYQDTILRVMDRLIQKSFGMDFIKVSLLYFFMVLEQQMEPNERHEASSYNYTLLKNFRALVEKKYKDLHLPKQYAALLYITPNHLNALSKEYLGLSAGELIRNRILLEAKRLLVVHQYSISEIAYELNFSDNSYFTKFFKKMEGITPEEFRRKKQ